jgi:hypothetical protein
MKRIKWKNIKKINRYDNSHYYCPIYHDGQIEGVLLLHANYDVMATLLPDEFWGYYKDLVPKKVRGETWTTKY